MNQIALKNARARLENTRKRINAAASAAGRAADDIHLLAVSKTRPAETVVQLHELGQHAFGESYVDEGVAKITALQAHALQWHYVGPIQSNKTRLIAAHFDWVHSVDRARIVRRLNDQRPEELAPLEVLVQVNIDGEAQKAGCAPEEIAELAEQISDCANLRLRGLMAIPAPREEHDDQRAVFARLYELFTDLRGRHQQVDTFSAGMSADLEAAIAEGSTLVRVGTALFGPRD